MRRVIACLVAGVVSFIGISTAKAAVISVNFIGGGGTVSPTSAAGAVPALNWNNQGGYINPVPVSVVDDQGNIGASLSFVGGGIYNAAAVPPGDFSNGDMMNGYLNGGNPDPGTYITVSDLGAPFTTNGYKILVYQNSDHAGATGYTATDTATNTATSYIRQLSGNGNAFAAIGFVGNSSASIPSVATNYVELTGFTASSFTINWFAGDGDGRAAPNGFQIVAVPEPATLGLVSLAGFAVLGRRRRA